MSRPRGAGDPVPDSSARSRPERARRAPADGHAAPHQAAAPRQAAPEVAGNWFARLVIPPDIEGPRVRLGVLWFFVLLAAVTSGRWWTAALWSLVAFVAAFQMVVVWARYEAGPDASGVVPAPVLGAALLSGLGAVAITLAAAYSTGLAGVVLTALAATSGVALVVGGPWRSKAEPVVVGMLLAGIAAASVVIAVRIDLWAGLFLVLAVSLYDAGAFLLGAEASGRWEGPVGGVVGVLAVTFTMSTIHAPPFDRAGAWITGVAVAVACVLGQFATSAFLPRPAARATALRRLDAYVLAGPTFVACAWFLGS